MGRRLVLDKTGPIAAVRTGPDGRFRMIGVGRDRVVVLMIEGESIVESTAVVLTTGDPAFKPLSASTDDSEPFKLLGPRFELALAPGRVVEGTVRDRDTGRPIPGAKVGSSWSRGEATCDGQGRFRLGGMPKAADSYLTAIAEDQPYVRVNRPVGDPQGLGPVRADVELKRGVWIEGKVINRSSGRPVKAIVQYLAFRDNPHVKDYPEAAIFKGITGSSELQYPTDADGRFRAVAPPGGGILVVRSLEPGYLTAKPLTPEAAGNVLDPPNFAYPAGPVPGPGADQPARERGRGHPRYRLDPGPAAARATRRPGWTAGRADAQLRRARPHAVRRPRHRREFTFIHPGPASRRRSLIFSEDRELAAFVDIKGDEPDPIRVVLRPSGTVTGRLVDEDGRPRPNVRLESALQPGRAEERVQRAALLPAAPDRPRRPVPDRGTRPGAALHRRGHQEERGARRPDYEGNLHGEGWTLKPGEVRDWGDVRPIEDERSWQQAALRN